jgi:hypothetical protein
MTENNCQFRFNDGKKCNMNSILEKSFCRTHLFFEGKVDTKNYKWCDKHLTKPMIHDGDEKYYCKGCIKIKAIEDEKIYCLGITKNKNNCTNTVLKEGEYCKLHKTYEKIQIFINNDIKICNNWKRGCMNEILDEYKRCIECRNKERTKDNEKRKNNREIVQEYNKKHNKTKMCIKCLCTFEKLANNFCTRCNKQRKKIDEKRIRNPILVKIYDSKASARNRNLEYKINDDYAKELFEGNCYYCNVIDKYKLNGIDRIDSNKGYIENNCVSCCFQCNSMKSNKPIENFYKICEHIVTYNKLYNGKLYPILFNKSSTSNYTRYKLTAEIRGINFYLNENETNKLFTKKCYYCGNFEEGCNGIDRLNSN